MTQAAVAQNWFATLALLAWPVHSSVALSNATGQSGDLVDDFGSLLLLPVGASIKLAEGIPQLDKTSIPNLAALVGCLLIRRLRFLNGFRMR